ncbi:Mu transposase C-terminal domain-containing protein [Caulobacter segnis]|uniref:Mu transposase C-terminal domain-containing protein n=1 Tax=Caulobacter segnis TaxID=88688 RepID=UPI001CBACBDF|nr:Mu transposase C-terminal domain-containing protein [Caulobacter segnis]UAL10102.1 DDE-type integrase/transposase/recombinase [Caulobacter segnis]
MSASIRFTPQQVWEVDGQKIRYVRDLGDGLLHFSVDRTGGPLQIETPDGMRAPDRTWAIEMFGLGRLRQLPTIPESADARRLAAVREYAPDEVLERDPQAAVRRFVLSKFDEAGFCSFGEHAIRLQLCAIWAYIPVGNAVFLKKPGVRTVRRWLEKRGVPGERPMRQMLSLSGRVPRRRRLPATSVRLLQKAAIRYWTTRYGVRDVYAWAHKRLVRLNRWRVRAGEEPLRVPSQEILRKEIRKLECYDSYAAKFGEKLAQARFKADGKGLSATRFLQIGCMDHTQVDSIAVLDAENLLPLGRPYLTVLIDVKTRCILAFVLSFEPPSLYQAMECIKRANRPKLHLKARKPKYPVLADIFGRFDEIVVDNGWEFAGKSFEDSMADMSTAVRWAPVKSPTYKAIGERFFGILNTLLLQKLPGGTLKPELMRQMGYDPFTDAILTLGQLEDLIWEAICYYHIEEHSDLLRPPADVWRRDMEAFGIPVIGDDRQLDRMLGQIKYPRTLTKSGVELFGLQFHDESLTGALLEDLISLEPRRGQRRGSATAKVKVKYNPANIAEINVWNQRRNLYVTLPCTDDRYASGISFWHHNQLRAWTKECGLRFSSEEDRLLARAELQRLISDYAPELRGKERRAAARLLHSPTVEATLEGHGIGLAFAPARHDGLAPIIEHRALAAIREDGDTPPTRSARSKPKPKQSKSKRNSPPRSKTPDSYTFTLRSTPLKGFE